MALKRIDTQAAEALVQSSFIICVPCSGGGSHQLLALTTDLQAGAKVSSQLTPRASW